MEVKGSAGQGRAGQLPHPIRLSCCDNLTLCTWHLVFVQIQVLAASLFLSASLCVWASSRVLPPYRPLHTCRYVPAMCVWALTLRVSFVLLNLSCLSGLDFIPVLFRYVVRPLRKLLFCLMICAQSRNWGRRRDEAGARSWPTMGENMENYWNNNFLLSPLSLSLSLPFPYSVCSTKGEAKQQNTKTEKRKNENTKRKEKKRDKIWKFLFINFATVSRAESSLSIDFLGHQQRWKDVENQIKIKNR